MIHESWGNAVDAAASDGVANATVSPPLPSLARTSGPAGSARRQVARSRRRATRAPSSPHATRRTRDRTLVIEAS